MNDCFSSLDSAAEIRYPLGMEI